MPLKLSDRVRENTATVGSGVLSLVGNTDGFRRFNDVLASGDSTYYCIEENDKFEIGVGTYFNNTLSRDFILQSTQSGSKINLGGSGIVFLTYPADKAVYKNQESEVVVGPSGIRFFDNTVQKTATVSSSSQDLVYISGIAIYSSGQSIFNEADIVSVSGWAKNYIDSQEYSSTAVSGWADITFLKESSNPFTYISGIAVYASGNIGTGGGGSEGVDTYTSGIATYASGQSIANQVSIGNLTSNLAYVSGLAVLAEESIDVTYISGIAVYASGKIYDDTYVSGIAVYASGRSIANEVSINNINMDIVYLSGIATNAEETLDINYVSGIAGYASGQAISNQSSISNINNDLVYVSGLAVLAEESLDITYISGIAVYASGKIYNDTYLSGIATYASGQSISNQSQISAVSGWADSSFLRENSSPFIYLSGLVVTAEESTDVNYISGIATYSSGQSIDNEQQITSVSGWATNTFATNNNLVYVSGISNYASGQSLTNQSNITSLNNDLVYISGLAVLAEESLDINYVSGIAVYSSGKSINNENIILATSGWAHSTFATNVDLQYVSGIAVAAEESNDLNYVSGIAVYVSGNALYNLIEDTSPQLGGNLDTNLFNVSGVGNIISSTGIFSSLKINNIDVSVSGHTHIASDITNFSTAVSGLIPVKNIVGGNNVSVSSFNGEYSISASGLVAGSAESIVTTVFNKTGSPIQKMTAVYLNGGQGDLPTIQKAIAISDATSAATYGLTYEAIDNMATGRVIIIGSLTGLNTDQFNPTSPHGNVNGVVVYLSPTTSGALTITKPYAPNHIVSLGTIVRTHQNQGIIEVRIQNGFELEELHNVAISGVINGEFLQYNSSSGLWVASNSGYFSNLHLGPNGLRFNDGTNQTTSGLPYSSGNLIDKNKSDIIYLSGLVVAAEETSDINYISGIAIYSSGQSIENEQQITSLSGWATNTFATNNSLVYVSGVASYASGQSLINQSNISLLNDDLVYISGLAVLAEETLDINYVSGIVNYASGQSINNQQDILSVSGWATNTFSTINNLNYVSGISNYASGQTIANQSDIITLNSDLIYISGLAILAEESLDINYVSGVATYASGKTLNNEASILATSGWSDSTFATKNSLSYVSGISVYASGQSINNQNQIVAVSGWTNSTFLKDTSPPFVYLSGLVVMAEESSDISYVSGIAVYSSGLSIKNQTDIIAVSGLITGSNVSITNPANNRILTSDGTSTGINAESNLTFDGTNLGIGTSTPNAKLEIQGSSGVYTRLGTTSSSFYVVHNGTTDTFLYTQEASPLRLGTSATERLRITSAGDVGIGSTSPTTLLHILGTGEGIHSGRVGGPRPHLRLQHANGTVASRTISANGNYVGQVSFEGYNGTSYMEHTGIFGIINGTVTTSSIPTDLVFSAGSSGNIASNERMRITSAGNVGIGLTPSFKLDVYNGNIRSGYANNSALLVAANSTASTGAAIAIQQTTGEGWTAIFADFEPYAEWGFYHDNPNNRFDFTAGDSTNSLRSYSITNRTGNTATAYAKVSILQSSGDLLVGGSVGIGTSSPSQKLQIVGNATLSGSLTVSTANTTGGGIILGDDGDIVDLNDGFCAMRFSSGVRIFSGNRTGSAVITLGSNGTVTATTFSGALSGNASTATTATRSTIEDTRAAQRTPNDYDDFRASYEFTNQFTGLADWHSGFTMQGWSNGYASWQIIGPASTSAHENFYLRSGINTSWNSMRTILHSGNYNSYAPTLTGGGASGTWGISISGDLTKTAPTIGYTVSGAAVSYGGHAGPQILGQGGSGAIITFHRPGAYAINLGLDTDNQVKIGGWSFGAVAYKIVTADSRNSRGATRLYRNDNDSDFSVQTYWTGSRWRLYGYTGDTVHADTHVGYADISGSTTTAESLTAGNKTINGNLTVTNSIFTQMIFDSNNTGYYLDPSGTSNIVTLVAGDTVYSYNWFRSYGATGWFNQTYDGGIWMTDSTYVRVYNNKIFYNDNSIQSATSIFAPIFYDWNNSAFYLDPNGSSRLSSMIIDGQTCNGWIDFPNHTGLRAAGLNNAHFYPNNASFGSWRIAGTRNGWAGIEFDSTGAGNVSLMMNSGRTGAHNNSHGWQWYWENGDFYISKSTFGGGTAVKVLTNASDGNSLGSVKAFVSFNGQGSPATNVPTYIKHNVSAVWRTTTGEFQINFINHAPSTNYVVTATGTRNANIRNSAVSKQVSYVAIEFRNESGVLMNPIFCDIAVFW